MRKYESLETKPIYSGDNIIGEMLICQYCGGPLPHYSKWRPGRFGPFCCEECQYRGGDGGGDGGGHR